MQVKIDLKHAVETLQGLVQELSEEQESGKDLVATCVKISFVADKIKGKAMQHGGHGPVRENLFRLGQAIDELAGVVEPRGLAIYPVHEAFQAVAGIRSGIGFLRERLPEEC